MRACVSAGIAKAEIMHIDVLLIRADVSCEALAQRWVEKLGAENPPVNGGVERDKTCTTDPNATMAASQGAISDWKASAPPSAS